MSDDNKSVPAMPELPPFEPGSVWLVGAGPGDPGLLSLLAFHALGAADDIVYDALVGEDILALAGAGAQLHYAGKRGGKPSAKQGDISEKNVECDFFDISFVVDRAFKMRHRPVFKSSGHVQYRVDLLEVC